MSAIDGRAATPALTGRLLFLLAGLAALGALSTNVILPSFPSIGMSLGITARDLGPTLSSFFVAFAIGQLFVGPLSDRYGRRPLVLGGLAVFAIGSAVCATADSLAVLILGRVVQAIGVCAASVLSRAIARDLFDGAALARALSLVMVAMAAAPGFSPLLGSALDSMLGWRSSFVVVGGLGLVLAVHYLLDTGETHPADRRAALMPLRIVRAYAGLAADARFILPAGAVSLVLGALYAFFAAAPAILMEGLGLSSLQLGLFFASTVFVVFAAGLAAPRLAHRFGAPRTMIAGTALAALGGAGLLATAQETGFATFTAAITVFLFGMGLTNPLGTAITLHPFSDRAGLASALLGFLQLLCAAIGTTIATSLGFDPAAALGVVLTGASTLALLAGSATGIRLAGRGAPQGAP